MGARAKNLLQRRFIMRDLFLVCRSCKETSGSGTKSVVTKGLLRKRVRQVVHRSVAVVHTVVLGLLSSRCVIGIVRLVVVTVVVLVICAFVALRLGIHLGIRLGIREAFTATKPAASGY